MASAHSSVRIYLWKKYEDVSVVAAVRSVDTGITKIEKEQSDVT